MWANLYDLVLQTRPGYRKWYLLKHFTEITTETEKYRDNYKTWKYFVVFLRIFLGRSEISSALMDFPSYRVYLLSKKKRSEGKAILAKHMVIQAAIVNHEDSTNFREYEAFLGGHKTRAKNPMKYLARYVDDDILSKASTVSLYELDEILSAAVIAMNLPESEFYVESATMRARIAEDADLLFEYIQETTVVPIVSSASTSPGDSTGSSGEAPVA